MLSYLLRSPSRRPLTVLGDIVGVQLTLIMLQRCLIADSTLTVCVGYIRPSFCFRQRNVAIVECCVCEQTALSATSCRIQRHSSPSAADRYADVVSESVVLYMCFYLWDQFNQSSQSAAANVPFKLCVSLPVTVIVSSFIAKQQYLHGEMVCCDSGTACICCSSFQWHKHLFIWVLFPEKTYAVIM